ncbi:hypothetical protein JCM8202v2_001179 [Rhodotorula sphaerocarpa]
MPLAPALQQVLDTLLSSLYNLQTSIGGGQKRYYSAIFRDLPDRQLYPDYYVVIKNPRCLHDIMNNMHRGLYSSPQAVAYDLFLIWSNAREYNEQGSIVYADADKLESFMERLWRERSPPLPQWETLVRPGQTPAATPAPVTERETDRKVKRIKLTGSLAHSSGGGSASVPSPAPLNALASTSAAPSPSIPSLTLKFGGGRLNPSLAPSAAPQWAGDVPVAGPASQSPSMITGDVPVVPAGPSTSTDVLVAGAPPKGAAQEGGGGDEETKHPSIPTIPDVESGWLAGPADPETLLHIVDRLRTYTDASGRVLASPIVEAPDPAARPDYYAVVPEPMSLNIIDRRGGTLQAKVRGGLYPSAEACDRDLFRLFEVAKLFIQPETPGSAYSDLMVLQRLYQELTKNDPSAARRAETESVAGLSSVSGGPGNVQHAKGDEGVQGSDQKSRATTRPTLRDKIFLDCINFKGQTLRTGKSPLPSLCRCLSVCWYYRPEETVHPVSRTFYENEVFKTGVFVDHNIEDLLGHCFVMFFTRYTRGRPKSWDPSMPLYVCEHRYKDDVKQFKKIKSWSSCIPEEIRAHEYEFEPYADGHVDQLARVKSPFTRGVPGPGRLDSGRSNTNAKAAPAYRFSNDGRPQTLEEAQGDVPVTAEAAAPATDLSVGPPAPEVPPLQLDLAALTAPAPSQSAAPQAAEGHGAAVVPSSAIPQAAGPSFDFSNGGLAGLPAFASPGAGTPAEVAATDEACMPIPPNLKSKFRSDAFGELLWFSAPAATVPPVHRASHSLAYLLWQTERKQGAA